MTSKIKVDNIENQCGGAVVTKCGATTTISGSVVKADDIQAADGGNLINQCGTTITLGASGDTINLAAGASQTGFGRTGTVDWDTTAKTALFTAVSGVGYFVNTTLGSITATLPATPSAGDIVAFKDYANTFDTNQLLLDRNGSNIDGVANNFEVTAEGQSITLVYIDATRGWVPTDAAKASDFSQQALFVTATGGTVTCCGDYKIHTFTGPGTFTVSCAGNPLGSSTVDYMVVAGGGGSGRCRGGGGGAGGYRESSGAASGCYSVSPLGACVSALPVSATGYPITVGAGGAGGVPGTNPGSIGANSVFSSITSTGGGGGAGGSAVGGNGGSGGGAADGNGTGGTGNSPPVSPPQGNNGSGSNSGVGGAGSGGGGGATAASPTNGTPANGAPGGAGATSSINGTPTARAGGGGGSLDGPAPGSAGSGGAGGGAPGGKGPGTGNAGTVNTGGGAGGSGQTSPLGAAGGSGIVIIRYKFQ
jgi:hypothetical protein